MCPFGASDPEQSVRRSEIDAIVDQRVRELLRDNIVREAAGPRSIPPSKLSGAGASSGDGLVWNGTMYVPTNVATQDELDASAALMIPKSIVDAAGDLIVGTADNTSARLAKGANNSSLGVNSAGTVAWRSQAYGRLRSNAPGGTKFRAAWATVPFGASEYSSGMTPIIATYNSGFQVAEAGMYRVVGSVSFATAVQSALAVMVGCPNSNVNMAAYLVTTHQWNLPTAEGRHSLDPHIVTLAANATVHLGIYTAGTETFAAADYSRAFVVERVG